MSYNGDMTRELIFSKVGAASRDSIAQSNRGQDAYDEWQSFRAGRTNAQIATDVGGGMTETEVAEVDSAYSACKATHDFNTNVASPAQGDRFYAWRIFS